MKLSATDLKIKKFLQQGCSVDRIAERIGRPGDLQRVKEGLDRIFEQQRRITGEPKKD